MTAENLKNKRL